MVDSPIRQVPSWQPPARNANASEVTPFQSAAGSCCSSHLPFSATYQPHISHTSATSFSAFPMKEVIFVYLFCYGYRNLINMLLQCIIHYTLAPTRTHERLLFHHYTHALARQITNSASSDVFGPGITGSESTKKCLYISHFSPRLIYSPFFHLKPQTCISS
jgi:hypothetical protein